VLPHDHDEIKNEHRVIRGLTNFHLVPDQKLPAGELRVSSGAFALSSEPNYGMSVDLEQSIIESGLDPKAYVKRPHFLGSISIVVAEVRALDCKVGYEPEIDNVHHGAIWGSMNDKKRKRLLKKSEWYNAIAGTHLNPSFGN
jgi:hypothetical protein